MNENHFMKLVQIKAREQGFTLFRNHVGFGWSANKHVRINKEMYIKVSPGDVILRDGRPLCSGLCEGSSDLIGWENNTGKFVAFETKTRKGILTEKQGSFIDAVNLNGGIGRCIREFSEIPPSSSKPTSDSIPETKIV